MVTKRQCAFCAAEIEPGRGLMFVKRDGSVFYFCSGTCRKHQMTYHRVGHRLKWTRAHALRKLATQTTHRAGASAAPAAAVVTVGSPAEPTPPEPKGTAATAPEPPASPPPEKATEPEKAEKPKKPRAPRAPRKSPSETPAKKTAE